MAIKSNQTKKHRDQFNFFLSLNLQDIDDKKRKKNQINHIFIYFFTI